MSQKILLFRHFFIGPPLSLILWDTIFVRLILLWAINIQMNEYIGRETTTHNFYIPLLLVSIQVRDN